MKKYILVASAMFFLNTTQSCSESELDLIDPVNVNANIPRTEQQLQMLLNGAYLTISSTNAYGTDLMIFGDLLGDNLFVSTTNASYTTTRDKVYSANQSDFNFYGAMYNVINNCNTIINDTNLASNDNLERMKAEAKALRGFAYFTLVMYYSPAPNSGANQEYGVPIVLGNYDSLLQPKRATVAEVYNQIISDLKAGILGAVDSSKNTFGKTAAKLLLSKVYLARRANGDAELALQLSREIINSPSAGYDKINALENINPVIQNANPAFPILPNYEHYFSGVNDATRTFEGTVRINNILTKISYNLPGVEKYASETIWELDQNNLTNQITGIGSNVSLPGYYSRFDERKCLLFSQSFYNSFASTDVRRGSVSSGLLTSTGVPTTDSPRGYWTNKYPKRTYSTGESLSFSDYFRNIKIFRFAEAQLNEIEALYLLGNTAEAVTKLNSFASSRNGRLYAGVNLLNDILSERAKEFYGEGQRFWDLKRYNLPIVKSTNCLLNCSVQPGDKLYVLPMSLGDLSSNPNLTQYPGYN
ncbi:RagB/SusD family nutrient uptake outer membrane protein [Epilithonimonas vandammei]|uniref:RagB/SusD family nutrient uptake outer membrane protein n=1 Tax=Epilithonimonas vandammei TaxID=2487072 RepID=A0A3G8Y0M8_9FLAO|nr:RagB/SusD family nutrient uptake outer membrane protein [Epilithonimonas vandammei]AZI39032.1 RagB/SusD family nutrient uptake outer membrane protein [Epilithonimonas vandammei]